MTDDPVRVLLVEDSPAEARQLLALVAGMRASYRLDWVHDLAGARHFLEEREPGVILLDLSLPDSQGMATFLAVQSLAPCAPIVVPDRPRRRNADREGGRPGRARLPGQGQVNGDLLTRAIRCAIER